MFTRTDRFQNNERSHKSIEVDQWGHGVRLRWLDNLTGETRSIFLDSVDTADLAEVLGEYTGISQLNPPRPSKVDLNPLADALARIAASIRNA